MTREQIQIGARVRTLVPDFDTDEEAEDQQRDIPVGTYGNISRLNHYDRQPHYDIFWENGGWTVWSEAELMRDAEVA